MTALMRTTVPGSESPGEGTKPKRGDQAPARDTQPGGPSSGTRQALHRSAGYPAFTCDCSACPPNSLRMAESTLSAKSASPRELNRS